MMIKILEIVAGLIILFHVPAWVMDERRWQQVLGYFFLIYAIWLIIYGIWR